MTFLVARRMLRHTGRAVLLSRPLWLGATASASNSSSSFSTSSGSDGIEAAGTKQYTGPLELLQAATTMVKASSDRLVSIKEKMDKPFSIPDFNKQVTLKEIVLHSRDAPPEDFLQDVAVKARATVLPMAEEIETDLKAFGQHYSTTVKPAMEQAAMICRDLPCGGASLELEKLQNAMDKGKSQLKLEGESTPCGKFTMASLDFLQTTYDTREQITLASRSALILRLAQEFNEPLTTVRNEDKDGEKKKRFKKVFAEQVVPTPWVKSNEEYQELFKIKEQIEEDQKCR